MLRRIGVTVLCLAALAGCDNFLKAYRAAEEARAAGSPAEPAVPSEAPQIHAPPVGEAIALAERESARWGASRPHFADFGADGMLDVFGWVDSDAGLRIVAFDGRTGQRMWISPIFAGLKLGDGGELGVVGEHIVMVDNSGTARSFRFGEETVSWSVALGERAEMVCDGGDGRVVIKTIDDKLHAFDIADGRAATPAPKQCTRGEATLPAVVRDRWSRSEDLRSAAYRRLDDQPELRRIGMDPEAALRVTPELRVVLGDRRSGTSVPMIAVLQGERLVWSAEVPVSDPLRARMSNDGISSADAQTAFVSYELAGVSRVAAFAVVDGRRLWDVELPGEFHASVDALFPVQDRLYVHQSMNGLRVLDRETGALRYELTRH
ncbi:MAG: PQQ-binding-like beta-propeller repeat protein [Myxococcales bacterium]|nr:PQQ-binding-like beta-propeller repeat protein [Myxococcales bacterium]